MKIVALVAVRNEELYLRQCLDSLIKNGIQFFIIDHDSSDNSRQIYQSYSKQHCVGVKRIPFDGYFRLRQQLEIKESIRRKLDADWVIHTDADEVLASRSSSNLSDVISLADEQGYNTINFDEYVFIPESEEVSYEGATPEQTMRHYYFFEPSPNRLMRAYKNQLKYNNINAGGHRLSGEQINIYPENQILKHYICLSLSHLKNKYASRKFCPNEINHGWHGNRLNVDWRKVKLPCVSKLEHLNKQPFHKATPYQKHFWEWPT